MIYQCFNKLKVTYKCIELDNRKDAEDIQDALEKLTGARSVILWPSLIYFKFYFMIYLFIIQVPRVFINGEFIGGGTEVKKMFQNGKLKELL